MSRNLYSLIASTLACASLLSACGPQEQKVEHWKKDAPPNLPAEGGVASAPVVQVSPRPMGAEQPTVKKLDMQVVADPAQAPPAK